MSIGLISHLENPTPLVVRELAVAAEASGADWLGLPDAFWWRDAWLLIAEAARATQTLAIGPVVTNPYMRHPFHTLSAIATLQELVGPRIQLGLGSGGSEVTGVAGISRRDAPERIEALARLVRAVADGAPLDEKSQRRLEVPLQRPPILIAGRAGEVLRTAGRVGDRALLWSVPASELARSVGLVHQGEQDRDGDITPGAVQVIWAPAVAHDELTRERHLLSFPYAVLNSRPTLQRRWGLDAPGVEEIRRLVVAGDAARAATLVPQAAVDDLMPPTADPSFFGERARELGVAGLAVPLYRVEDVAARVEWARAVVTAP